jgi:hypothetical protein
MPMTQNAHGHHTNSANRDEKRAPTTNPLGAIALKALNTIAFLTPGSYVVPRIAIPFGSKKAGPIP